jgi:peptide/nickel transport system permease protein
MLKYLGHRALLALPVIVGVGLITFFLIRLAPGDPVRTMLGNTANPDSIAFWRQYYQLDDPIWVQFVAYLQRVFTLSFGDSIQLKAPVALVVLPRAAVSLALIGYIVIISLAVAVPLAIHSAVRANKFGDNLIKLLMMISFAMPSFWLAISFVQIFSLRLGLFPASGIRPGVLPFIWSLTLPALTGAVFLAPVLIRTLRIAMIESLRAEHVEAARARGLSESAVLRRYVLRTSLISSTTVLGVSIGSLIGGTVIIENVFALPGLGTLVVNAVSSRDFPLVEAVVLLIGVLVVALSLLVDIVNFSLDPRIRR